MKLKKVCLLRGFDLMFSVALWNLSAENNLASSLCCCLVPVREPWRGSVFILFTTVLWAEREETSKSKKASQTFLVFSNNEDIYLPFSIMF